MRKLFVVVLAACFSTGCGNKGPLYLPDSKPAAKQPAKTTATAPAGTSTDDKK